MIPKTEDLEAKLKSIGAEGAAEVAKLAKDALPMKQKEIVDFLALKEEVNNKATSTVENIADYFFDFDELKANATKMIKSRMELDIISLNSVIYQLRTSDYAIAQILDEVSRGITNNSVRLFEALNSLQRTNIEATKTLSSMITIFEQQYASLKNQIKHIDMMESESEENDGVHRGTRKIFQEISDIDEEIESLNGRKDLDD